MPSSVALVTDSTSCLPADVAARWGIGVVMSQITIGDHVDREDRVARHVLLDALRRNLSVSTAPPGLDTFAAAYQAAAARGADEVVSVHISAGQSQIYQAALRAAATSQVPVHVVDSRTSGLSLGYAVLAAARAASNGGGPRPVMDALAHRLGGSLELIYVDTLEYLRRGGRVGIITAAASHALSMKPLLTMHDGQVAPLARVLGAERALRRLVKVAVRRIGNRPVDIGVEHFGAPARAASVLARLRHRLAHPREATLTECSFALGVHLGPGAVGISISPA
jgi:DegV family protein with EDD domain